MRPHRLPLRLLAALAVAVFLAAASKHATADVYIIVHAANPLQVLGAKQAVDLYMGRNRAFPQGEVAMTLDLPRDSEVRDQFYRLLTGMGPAQVNSYWSRLIFSGQTLPPRALHTEAEVAEMVRRNTSAIGYVSEMPADPALRVVLVLKDKDPR